MYRLSCDIRIGSYKLSGVVSVEIKSSWETLTDTATIELPSLIFHKGKFTDLALSQLIKRGDKVSIFLGYDGNNIEEFSGYVTRIASGSPVRIECEDAAWVLKKGAINQSFRSVSLRELLEALSALPLGKVADIGLGQFRISQATPAQVCDEVKKTYGLPVFVRNEQLWAGAAYQEIGSEYRFRYGGNIIEENSELVYQKAEDVKIKVKAVSIMPDNTKNEVEFGAPDGEQRTLNFYNVKASDLEKIAKQEAEKLRFDGFTGSFDTFGLPSVRHGDVVSLEDPKSSVKGRYLVKSVVKTFSQAGYRQRIEIDQQA